MPKNLDKEPTDGPNGSENSPGPIPLLLGNAFSRGVILALVPAVTACVISRAPQITLSELFGQNLPFPLDAISLILIAPLFFLVVSWLLLRTAQLAKASATKWPRSEVFAVEFLTGFLGFTAIFLLFQFFTVLAPDGLCDARPYFNLLWTFDLGMHQAQHCMRLAHDGINKTGWFYMQPMILQAWLNVIFVGASLWLLRRALIVWRAKFSNGSSFWFLWQALNVWIGKFVKRP